MIFDPACFRRQVRHLLDAHAAATGRPATDHALLREQIERGDDIHSRRTFPGHVTASAIILDTTGRQTLLIRHRALGRWLQPGGHYEAPDSLPASALREAAEETGLERLSLDPWHEASGLPIDIDTHRIPARPARDEPEHWHHDIRYVVRAASADGLSPDLGEVDQTRWHPVAALRDIAPFAFRRVRRLGLASA